MGGNGSVWRKERERGNHVVILKYVWRQRRKAAEHQYLLTFSFMNADATRSTASGSANMPCPPMMEDTFDIGAKINFHP